MSRMNKKAAGRSVSHGKPVQHDSRSPRVRRTFEVQALESRIYLSSAAKTHDTVTHSPQDAGYRINVEIAGQYAASVLARSSLSATAPTLPHKIQTLPKIKPARDPKPRTKASSHHSAAKKGGSHSARSGSGTSRGTNVLQAQSAATTSTLQVGASTIPSISDPLYSIVVQKDGKIVVLGAHNGTFSVLRYDITGTLDKTFGTNGSAVVTFTSGQDAAHAIAIDYAGTTKTNKDYGKIVVAGSSASGFVIARLNPNGALDSTFGTGGKVSGVLAGGTANGLILKSDGSILVGGTDSTVHPVVVRLSSRGVLDQTFGSGGVYQGALTSLKAGSTSATASTSAITPNVRRRSGGVLHPFSCSGCGGCSGCGSCNPSYSAPNVSFSNTPYNSIEGATFTAAGSISDPNPNESLSATVNYGDGTGDQPLDIDGSGNFSLSHLYAEDANYTINISVTDSNDNEQGGASASVSVAEVAPTVVSSPGNSIAFTANPIALYVTTDDSSSDPDPVQSINVVWGDGTNNTYNASDYGGTLPNPFPAQHTYSTFGTFSASASASAGDDGSETSSTVQVLPVSPTISGLYHVQAGTTYTLSLPQPFDTTHSVQWTLNWGDGTAPQVINGSPSTVTHTFTSPTSTDLIVATAVQNGIAYSSNYLPIVVTIGAPVDPPVTNLTVNFQHAYGGPDLGWRYTVGNVPDNGFVFGDQSSFFLYNVDYSYGWDSKVTDQVDSGAGPDYRYGTYAPMQSGSTNRIWSIGLAPGTYKVRIVSGNPNFTSGTVYSIDANGTSVIDYTPSGSNWYGDSSATVTVGSDHRLTLTNGADAKNNVINFIDITPTADLNSLPAAPSSFTAVAETSTIVNLNWKDNSDNDTGFKIYRSTDNTNFTLIDTTAENVTSWSDTVPTAGTYYYKIAATNSGVGDSASTSSVSVATASLVGVTDAPYGGAVWTVPGKIEAENFDVGTSGSNDSASINVGGGYRDSAVDIGGAGPAQATSSGTGYMIGWTAAGEWMKYTVNVTTTDSYRLDLSLASATPGGVIHVEVDGTNVTPGGINVPDTGGWLTFQVLSKENISLTQGTHVIRLVVDQISSASGGAGNCDWFQFTPMSEAAPAGPTQLYASPSSGSQVALSWKNTSSTASGFVVQRSSDGSTFTTIANLSSSQTKYIDASGSASTAYIYRVCATNSLGTSYPSNSVMLVTATSNGVALSPAADAYAGNAGGLVGTYSYLDAQSGSYTTYLKFDLSSVTGTITGAVLRLFGSELGLTQAGATARLSSVANTSWTETGSPPTGTTTALADETVNLATGRWYNWDISNYLLGQLANGQHVITLALTVTTSSTTPWMFNSHEAAGDQPVLLISRSAPATAPSSLTAAAVSGPVVNLTWVNGSGPQNGVYVERSSDGVNFQQIAALTGTPTTYTDSSVHLDQLYVYRVRAYGDSYGETAYSNTAVVTTTPISPNNLVGTADSDTHSATLTWQDRSAYETGFKIERSTDNSTFTTVTTTAANATTYTDTTAVVGTVYYYRVSAVNVSLTSSTTGPIKVALPETTNISPGTNQSFSGTLATFTDASGASDSAYSVLIDWGDGSAPTSGVVSAEPGVAGAFIVSGTHEYTSDGSKTVTLTVTHSTDRVVSTSTLTANAAIGIPPAVGSINAHVISDSEIDLTWPVPAGNPEFVYVEWETVGGTYNAPTQLPGTSVSYPITGLSGGTSYTFKVYATNSAGTSPDSTVTATTNPAAPIDGSAVQDSSPATDVNLSWSYPSGTGTPQYTVVLQSNDPSDSKPVFTQIGMVSGGVTTFTAHNISVDGHYTFRLYAKTGSAQSANFDVPYNAVLNAPSNLVATADDSAQRINLTWTDNAIGESGYKILRTTTVQNGQPTGFTALTFSQISGVTPVDIELPPNSTSFADDTAQIGITYYYEVEALNGSATSDPSNIASATLAQEVGGYVFHDTNGNGQWDRSLEQQAAPHIVIAVDTSESVALGTFQGKNDVNYTGLQAEVAGLIELNEQLIHEGFGDTADVSIIGFNEGASITDLNPFKNGDGTIEVAAHPSQDLNDNGIPDIEEALAGLPTSSGTNYAPVFSEINSVLQMTQAPAGSADVVFISDGQPHDYVEPTNTDYINAVNSLTQGPFKAQIHAFDDYPAATNDGQGAASSEELMAVMDPNVTMVYTTDDLLSALSQLPASSASEAPVAGQEVSIEDSNQIKTTKTTDSDGRYSFNEAPGTYTVSIVPPTGDDATTPVTQTVTLTSNQSADNVNFGIVEHTDAPTITLSGASTVDEGSTYLLSVDMNASGPARTYTYSYDFNYDGNDVNEVYDVVGSASDMAGWVFPDGVAGGTSDSIKVSVTDQYGHTVTATKNITINNVAPFAQIIVPQGFTHETDGDHGEFTSNVFDPSPVDSTSLTYSWQVTQETTPPAPPTNYSTKVLDLVITEVGLYDVQLTITDKDGGSYTAHIPHPLDVEDANPHVTAPTATLSADLRSVNLTATGSDDRGEANLTYYWIGSDDKGAVAVIPQNSSHNASSTTALLPEAGKWTFSVFATDSDHHVSTDTDNSVTIDVAAVPTAVSVTPQVFNIGSDSTQALTATVYDQFGNLMDPTNPQTTYSVVYSVASPAIGSIDAGTSTYRTGSSGPGQDMIHASVTANGATATGDATAFVQSSSGIIWRVSTGMTTVSGKDPTFMLAEFYDFAQPKPDPVTHPDPWLYDLSIDWGDGTTEQDKATNVTYAATGALIFQDADLDHAYATAGTYTFHLTMTSEFDHSQTGPIDGTITVLPSSKVGDGVAITTPMGQAFNGTVATLSDSNPLSVASNLSAQIDWGDGSGTTTGAIVSTGTDQYKISGGHTYTDVGSYTITVSLKENNIPCGAPIVSTATVSRSGAPAPTGFISATISPSQIELEWDQDLNAAGYILYATQVSGDPSEIGATHRIPVTAGTMFKPQVEPNNSSKYAAWDQNLLPDTRYMYSIQAVYPDGTISPEVSLAAPATTALGEGNASVVPAGLTGEQTVEADPKTGILSEGVQLYWQPVDGAAGYKIYRCDGDTWQSPGVDILNDPNNYVDATAIAGGRMAWFDEGATFSDVTAYTYKVYAHYSDGSDSGYATQAVLANSNAPSKPTGLKAASFPQGIQLTWDDRPKSDDALFAGWIVERQTIVNGVASGWVQLNAQLITDVTGYNDLTAPVYSTTNPIICDYRILSQNLFNTKSLPSDEVQYKRSTHGQPLPPTGFFGEPAGDVSGNPVIQLDWDADTPVEDQGWKGDDLANYQISLDNGATWITISPTATSYQDTSTHTAGSTYNYLIKAVDGDGDESDTSATSVVAANGTAPAAPTVTASPVNGSMTSIHLSWTAGTGLASYAIYRSTSASSGFEQIKSVNASTTTFDDGGLASATTYFYRVYAIDSSNNYSSFDDTRNHQASATTNSPASEEPPVLMILPVVGSSDNSTQLIPSSSLSDGELGSIGVSANSAGGGPTIIDKDTPVYGLVDDPNNNLVSWRLVLRSLSSTSTVGDIVISSGTTEVGQAPDVTAQLGTIQPTMMPDGLYQLVLISGDPAKPFVEGDPNQAGEQLLGQEIQIKTQVKTGNFTLPVTDLSLPVAGGNPIVISRTYDSSLADTNGDFGYGWSMDLFSTHLHTTAYAGNYEVGGQPALRQGDLIYITLPNLGQQVFEFVPHPPGYNPGNIARGIVTYDSYNPQFVAVDGSGSTLTVDDNGGVPFDLKNSFNEFYSGDNGEGYNPAFRDFGQHYYVTTKDGARYQINAVTGDLETITTANGVVTTYTRNVSTNVDEVYSGPQHVYIHHDLSGNVDWVSTDPNGANPKISYSYTNDNLTAVTDRNGNTTHYGYEGSTTPGRSHLMVSATDPRGIEVAKVSYDQSRHATSITNATSNSASIGYSGYNGANGLNTTTDPSGNASQSFYDSHGNTIRTVQPVSDGFLVTLSTYTYANSADDVVGYGISNVNALADETHYQPVLVKGADLAGTRFTGDVNSLNAQPASETKYRVFNSDSDADGQTGIVAPDTLASLFLPSSQSVWADDGTQLTTLYTYTANSHGKPATIEDPYGNITKNCYDASGNLIKTTTRYNTANAESTYFSYTDGGMYKYVDGTQIDYTNVPTGLPLETWKKASDGTIIVTSRNIYYTQFDPASELGLLKRSTDAAGLSTFYNYTDQGQLKSTESQWLDAAGGFHDVPTSSSQYDAEGRQTQSTDANQQTTTTHYDGDGNVDYTIDEYGGVTVSVYDSNGHVIRTVNPDGTETRTAYDNQGRAVWTTDRFYSGAVTSVNSTTQLASIDDTHDVANVTTFLNHTDYDASGRVTGTERYQDAIIPLAADPYTDYANLGLQQSITPQIATRATADTITLVAWDTVHNAPFVGSLSGLTATISKDGASAVATTNTPTQSTEDVVTLSLTAAEMTADQSYITASTTHSGVVFLPLELVTNLLSSTATVYDDYGRVAESKDASGLRTGTIYYPNGQVQYTGPLLSTAGSLWYESTDPTQYFDSYTESKYDLKDSLPTGASYYNVTIQHFTRNGTAVTETTKTYMDALGRSIMTVYDDGSFTETLYSVNDSAVTRSDLTQPTSDEGWPGSGTGNSTLPHGYTETVQIAQRKTGDTPQATYSLYDSSGKLVDVWQPAVAVPYAGTVLNDQPVGYWRMSESTGLTAHDSTTNANDGTYSNVTLGQSGALVAGGDSDTAANFNGSSSNVSVPDNSSLEITKQLTLECWINYSMSGGTGAPGIITKDDRLHVSGYGLYAGFDSNQNLEFTLNLNGSSQSLTSANSYNDGQWHYVVATYDGAKMKLYVDGSLVDQRDATGTIGTNTHTLMIGAFDGTSTDTYFDGKIDDAAVYNYPLTAAQISQHYAASVGSFQRPHWHYTYDPNGNELTETDPKGNTTSFTYDEQNREKSRTLPDSTHEDFTYDSFGRLETHTDFVGNVATSSYFTKADDPQHAGMLKSIAYTGPGQTAYTVTYSYDHYSRKSTVVDPADVTSGNDTTTYNYDESGGNVTIDPNTGAMTPVAGNFGELTSVASPQGTIHYVYDAVTGRLIETWTGTGADDTTSTTETLYGYDSQGRLASVTTAREDGAAVGLTSSVSTRYDAVGHTISTSLPTTLYIYDGAGELLHQLNPNNTETDYDYSNLWNSSGGEEIVTNKRSSDGTTLSQFTYTFNAQRQKISELDQMTDAGETASNSQLYTWAYDADGRLTDETFDNQKDGSGGTNAVTADDYHDHYDYDLDGNRLDEKIDSQNDGGAWPTTVYDQVTNYLYNANNELTTETQTTVANGTTVYSTSYLYDDNGSLKQSTRTGSNPSVTTYTYDARNRILTVASGTSSTAYTYDDDGRLVQQATTVNQTTDTTTYLIDGKNPTGYSQVLEVRKNGSLTTTYTLGKSIIAQNAGGTISYIMADGHVSTRQLVAYTTIASTNGHVIARYEYDAFGNPITLKAITHATNTADTSLLYSEMLLDPTTGNYQTESRQYTPADGRFFWQDNYMPTAGDTGNANLYVYAGANPIDLNDPSGHFSVVGTLAMTGTIGLVSGAVIGGIRGGLQGAVEGARMGLLYGLVGGAAIITGGAAIAYLSGAAISVSAAGITAAGGGLTLAEGIEISGFVASSFSLGVAADQALHGHTREERAAGWTGVALSFGLMGFSSYRGAMVGDGRLLHYDVGGGATPTILAGYDNVNLDPSFGNDSERLDVIAANEAAGTNSQVGAAMPNMPLPSYRGARVTATSIPPSAYSSPESAAEIARLLGPRGQVVVGGNNDPSVYKQVEEFARQLDLGPVPPPDPNSPFYFVQYNYSNLPWSSSK